MSEILQHLNTEMADVAENVGAGLVRVHGSGGGVGAGAVWHPDGLIITNAHVVRRGPYQVILRDGRRLPASLLAHDSSRDLAALSVDATGLATVGLGSSRDLQPGQWVLALGHPWGILGAVTAGVVIGMGPEREDDPQTGQDWIEVSLHLRPGYSGGPLADIHGRLVGINTMMTGPDVGVAIPVHAAKAFLKRNLGSWGGSSSN